MGARKQRDVGGGDRGSWEVLRAALGLGLAMARCQDRGRLVGGGGGRGHL